MQFFQDQWKSYFYFQIQEHMLVILEWEGGWRRLWQTFKRCADKKKKNSSSVALILYSYFKEMGYFEIIAWLTFYVSNFIIIMCNNVQVNL